MNKFFVAIFAVFACVCAAMAGNVGYGYGNAGYGNAGYGYGLENIGYAAQVEPAVSLSALIPAYNIPMNYQNGYGYGMLGNYGSQIGIVAPQVARYSSAAAAGSSVRSNLKINGRMNKGLAGVSVY